MAKELAPPSLGASAPFARVGSSMLPGALPRSGENSDIFVLISSIPSTLFGRDSAVLRNGTAMNGDNVFPTTRIAVAPRANGRRTRLIHVTVSLRKSLRRRLGRSGRLRRFYRSAL